MRKIWSRMISCLVVMAMIVTSAGVSVMADTIMVEEIGNNEVLTDVDKLNCHTEETNYENEEYKKNSGDIDISITDEMGSPSDDTEINSDISNVGIASVVPVIVSVNVYGTEIEWDWEETETEEDYDYSYEYVKKAVISTSQGTICTITDEYILQEQQVDLADYISATASSPLEYSGKVTVTLTLRYEDDDDRTREGTYKGTSEGTMTAVYKQTVTSSDFTKGYVSVDGESHISAFYFYAEKDAVYTIGAIPSGTNVWLNWKEDMSNPQNFGVTITGSATYTAVFGTKVTAVSIMAKGPRDTSYKSVGETVDLYVGEKLTVDKVLTPTGAYAYSGNWKVSASSYINANFVAVKATSSPIEIWYELTNTGESIPIKSGVIYVNISIVDNSIKVTTKGKKPDKDEETDFTDYLTTGYEMNFYAYNSVDSENMKWTVLEGGDYCEITNQLWSSSSKKQTVTIKGKGDIPAGEKREVKLTCIVNGVRTYIDSDDTTVVTKSIYVYGNPSLSYSNSDRTLKYKAPEKVNTGTTSGKNSELSDSTDDPMVKVTGVKLQVLLDGKSLGFTSTAKEKGAGSNEYTIDASVMDNIIRNLDFKFTKTCDVEFRAYPCNGDGKFNKNIYKSVYVKVYKVTVVTEGSYAGASNEYIYYGLDGQVIDIASQADALGNTGIKTAVFNTLTNGVADVAATKKIVVSSTESLNTYRGILETIASGSYGNITWTVDGKGKLTIEGTGNIRDIYDSDGNYIRFDYNMLMPWFNYSDQIKEAVVNVKDATDLSGLFSHCYNLTKVDLSSTDTSKVTNMSWMFKGCHSLTTLDLSRLDTSSVTDMSNMFSDCGLMTSLNLNGFNTSHVTDMTDMFSFCYCLDELNLNSFNTANVTTMKSMFLDCGVPVLDLSGFDTSNVTDMSYMFCGCSPLTTLNIGSFNTSKVKNMAGMFCGCCELKALDVSGFDTSNVTDMKGMFTFCENLKSLNTSRFDTKKVTSVYGMFTGCNGLTSLDLSNFDLSSLDLSDSPETNASIMPILSGYILGDAEDENTSVISVKSPKNLKIDLGLTSSDWTNSATGEKGLHVIPANTAAGTLFVRESSGPIPLSGTIYLVPLQRINIKSVIFPDITETISRYTVNDKKIALVSKDMLKAKKFGKVTVSAEKKEGNTYTVIATREISVLSRPKLKFSSPFTYMGQTKNANDYFTTEDTKLIGVTYWESSKSSVVEVIDAENGILKANGNGSAKITAYFGKKGEKGTVKLTTSISVKVPAFAKKEYTVMTGATKVISMKNVTKAQNIEWRTDDETIATASAQINKKGAITGKGVVTGLSYGDCTLTAVIDGKEYNCIIHVTAPEISKKNMTVRAGRTSTISLKKTKIKKADVEWFSSDESIATVGANGKVKGISKGQAIIYTETGGVRNECVVTVK